MLDQMRRGVTNLFTKFLLALLIVAFAVWGIGDVVRRSSQGALATVGKTEITTEEFRQAYQDEIQSISRRLGRRLTPEQAKLLNLPATAPDDCLPVADSHDFPAIVNPVGGGTPAGQAAHAVRPAPDECVV